MKTIFCMLELKLRDLLAREEGQDLVEYALLLALVSLAAVSALNGLASSIISVFSSISTTLGTSV